MRTSRTSCGLLVSVLALLVGSVGPAAADALTEPSVPGTTEGDVPDPAADLLPADRVHARQAAGGRALVGTFVLDPGDCGGPSGTYFRMAQPGGSPDDGPFVENNDSPCDDSSVTPLQPGTDGGLITGEYQPHPDPAFSGNAGVADRITEPQAFFGTDFAVATNPTDPQTGRDVTPPEIRVDGSGAISGDVRAFAAAWQTQHFNQGSPKPNGSAEGTTTPVTGTFDDSTGRFVVEWSSQIEDGPFNNFTGVWHLEGVFQPARSDAETSSPTTAAPDPVESGSSPATTSAPAASTSLPSTGGAGLSWPAVALVALAVGVVALRARLRR